MGRVEEILDDLGLKPSDAVNMLFAQIERRGCLPFEVSLHHEPMMSEEEQAKEWTRSLGEY
jgi:addiction module RelB/DinJ family antitoxin